MDNNGPFDSFNYDAISLDKDYWGEVVLVDDETKQGKIRIRIAGIFGENIPDENIPWAMPRFQHKEEYCVPPIGSKVQVRFLHNNIHFPEWWLQKGKSNTMSDEDYPSGVLLFERDLEEFELDGKVSVRYTESEGLVTELTKNDNVSTTIIRPDNSIFLKNGSTGHVVHLSETGISLGTEEESAEPGVLGDKNREALDKLNENIKELAGTISSHLDKLKTASQSSPYTMHLVPLLIAFKAELDLTEKKTHKAIEEFIPSTLSEIITVD